MLRSRLLYSAASVAILMSTAAPALAQNLPAEIEEIIVTAQRREQRLIDTPLSVSAFSAEQIE